MAAFHLQQRRRRPLRPVPGVRFDHDVPVPMRDGVHLMANVYRPEQAGRYPRRPDVRGMARRHVLTCRSSVAVMGQSRLADHEPGEDWEVARLAGYDIRGPARQYAFPEWYLRRLESFRS